MALAQKKLYLLATLTLLGAVFCLPSAKALDPPSADPLSTTAPILTEASWTNYTDKSGLIHSELVHPPPLPGKPSVAGPSNGNGLLYTSEACVIMELRHVSYAREKIYNAIKTAQVKPGLFDRSPELTDQEEAPDDYIGLGALAGICGFHDIARDILNYGKGDDQASGATVVTLYPDEFSHLKREVNECKTVSYNYNNVSPGTFRFLPLHL